MGNQGELTLTLTLTLPLSLSLSRTLTLTLTKVCIPFGGRALHVSTLVLGFLPPPRIPAWRPWGAKRTGPSAMSRRVSLPSASFVFLPSLNNLVDAERSCRLYCSLALHWLVCCDLFDCLCFEFRLLLCCECFHTVQFVILRPTKIKKSE